MSTVAEPAGPEGPRKQREYTPEDLLAMPDGDRYELIDGQLVERNMGAKASKIAANFIRLVGNYNHQQKAGKVFSSDCGYQIFLAHPLRVRYADASFVARGRLPEEKTPDGHMTIAPDLGLEVVSPNDVAERVEAKRVEWQQAGVRLLWLVYPETRTVYVYRRSGDPSVRTEIDELSGEDALPGFSCRVAELFEGV